ncbi:hypothetical protein [Actinomyces vulturis]|uniref:hypothetical protein n=1 Tax=Actinomyces vulturis TaxID=1857645 RepID=UPI00082DCD89|nr:hypothetical protein [Actinomyces vulturis]
MTAQNMPMDAYATFFGCPSAIQVSAACANSVQAFNCKKDMTVENKKNIIEYSRRSRLIFHTDPVRRIEA